MPLPTTDLDPELLSTRNVHAVLAARALDESLFSSGQFKFGRFLIEISETASYNTAGIQDNTENSLLLVCGADSWHSVLRQAMYDATRDLANRTGSHVRRAAADYGSVIVLPAPDDNPDIIIVTGSSMDFGRGGATSRRISCDTFALLLGDTVTVEGVDINPPRDTKFLDSTPRLIDPYSQQVR
jgi:hypothetical protein